MKDLTITSVIKVYEYDELNDADRALLDDAIEATRRSYAPYSHFSVGAAVLLANDSVLITGDGLLQTFDRLEVAEFSAKSLIMAAPIGELKPITDKEVEDLRVAFHVK